MFYALRSFKHPLAKIKRKIFIRGAKWALPIGIGIGFWINPIIVHALSI